MLDNSVIVEYAILNGVVSERDYHEPILSRPPMQLRLSLPILPFALVWRETFGSTNMDTTHEKKLEAGRRWREKNKEAVRAYGQAWRRAHPEKCSAYGKKYYAGHKEQVLQRTTANNHINKEKNLLRAKLRRLENPEKTREIVRRSYRRRKLLIGEEAFSLEAHQRYERDKVKHAKLMSEWWKNNKDKSIEYNRRKRARKANAIQGTPYGDWLKELKRHREFTCYWCKKKTPIKHLHVDHILPLNPQGKKSRVIDGLENVCASCSKCNTRKHNKPLGRWANESSSLPL